MNKFYNNLRPPICLHILGQGLVDKIWMETQELKAKLEAITSQADAQFKRGDKHATFNKQTIDSIRP